MKVNKNDAIVTSRILLVPYTARHVPTYHEWMQDEELQTLTASEPLTLDEEYAMCTSWREDSDKLTFIVCAAPEPLLLASSSTATIAAPTSILTPVAASSTTSSPSRQTRRITPGIHDTPSTMLGDVNLFLCSALEDEDSDQDEDQGITRTNHQALADQKSKSTPLVGELEIMIARPSARGKGLAHATLLAFLWYISTSLQAILSEYDASSLGKKTQSSMLQYLRVKIDKDNVKSIRLFEKVGFERRGGVNYFGEVELRMMVTERKFIGVDGSSGGGATKVVYAEEITAPE